MCNEYCDGIHCGNLTSLITLRHDELNYFENNWWVVCFVQFIDRVCVLKCFLGWTWIRREKHWRTLWSLGLRVNTPDLSAPLSLYRSHMVGAFSQNNMTLTGLPMILPSESDLTYQCVVCLVMYSWAPDEIFHWHGTTLDIGLSLSIFVA